MVLAAAGSASGPNVGASTERSSGRKRSIERSAREGAGREAFLEALAHDERVVERLVADPLDAGAGELLAVDVGVDAREEEDRGQVEVRRVVQVVGQAVQV